MGPDHFMEKKEMNKDTMKEYKAFLWKRWLLDVLIRTVKTGAEAFLAFISVGMVLSEVDWIHALSVTAVAMIYTVLINIYRIAADIDAANKQAGDENGARD